MCTDIIRGIYFVCDSNDNNSSRSFSPTELYVDETGQCYEYGCYEKELNLDPRRTVNIEHYIERGFFNVSGKTIEEIWFVIDGYKFLPK